MHSVLILCALSSVANNIFYPYASDCYVHVMAEASLLLESKDKMFGKSSDTSDDRSSKSKRSNSRSKKDDVAILSEKKLIKQFQSKMNVSHR